MERSRLKLFSLIIPLLVCLLTQLACGVSSSAEPTVSDEEMATRVALALTNVALSGVTGAPPHPEYTETLPLPTLGPPQTATATETPTLQVETETPLPSDTPTETPTATETPTETPLPSATQTPVPPNTATAGAPSFSPGYRDPAGYLGSPDWIDHMNDDRNWNMETDAYTALTISEGVMRLSGLTEAYGWRMAATPPLGNAYIEVKVKSETCSKRDTYGLIFRSPDLKAADQGYLFGVTCQGEYLLLEWDGKAGENGHMTALIPYTKDSNIRFGNNQENHLGVMLVDNHILLFVNGVSLAEISDNSYPAGYFGVMIAARETAYYSIRVDWIRYWLDAQPKK